MKAVPKFATTRSVTSSTPTNVKIVVISILVMVCPSVDNPSVSSVLLVSKEPTPRYVLVPSSQAMAQLVIPSSAAPASSVIWWVQLVSRAVSTKADVAWSPPTIRMLPLPPLTSRFEAAVVD